MRAFDHFLSSTDASRIYAVLARLHRSGLRFAITGSLALELHLLARGQTCGSRSLNDLDIVAESFNSLPSALADAFLVRHAHSRAPEGKMIIQLVDEQQKLRINVFCPYGQTLSRSQSLNFESESFQVVAIEDLAARTASLLMDLERGCAVARKHAEDFVGLRKLVNENNVEDAWKDHRKPADPVSFANAVERISELVASCGHLLVNPNYSHDIEAVCQKCLNNEAFPLASARTISSILGYC